MTSLRKRAWISGGLSALVAVSVGTFLLYSFLDQKALERFDNALAERHTQIVVALNNVRDEPERLAEFVFDPAYEAAASGRYWQVINLDGDTYTSASLFDALLPIPDSQDMRLTIQDAEGSDAERYRVAHQRMILADGAEWSVAVAEDRAPLEADRAATRDSLLLAFALVAALGLAGTLAQTAAILAPITKLRTDVAHRWEREEVMNVADYPEEVAPLVGDINTLLQRNREIVGRSRRQAADLAHALKTPSAILRNELTLLEGGHVAVDKALDALDRLDAQLARSLARIRTSNTGETASSSADLSGTVARFARLFGKMAEKQDKRISVSCDADLTVRVDPQDLEEILGNVLDNAMKWTRNRIALSARRVRGSIELVIEDDGVGVPEAEREAVLQSGRRLDTSKPGSGLGLQITNDLLKAYGGSLALGKSSDLGGLAVKILLPRHSG